MKHILIVEDEPLIKNNLKEFLELEDYWVWEASSGVEGLEIFERELIDLVISDILMPEMDGFELCSRIRNSQTGKFIPFIFLSAQADFSSLKKGYQYGADEYLVKPCQLEELKLKIDALLERNQRIHQEITSLLQKSTVDFNKSPETPKPQSENQQPEFSFLSEQLTITPAEERVFFEVIQGFTNKEIGEHLFISHRTVQAHLRNILRKLNLSNRYQLVRFALENGYKPQQNLENC
ncbi:response regulator transcription factor [Capilliphycus salinus ALCB114379]|uniref:response regulator transcription factor n=1 Tax=Capilliphycus salinus TaxID=2768948 RepID=UPI0039A4EDA7